METCSICGLVAKAQRHPCRFEKGCKCWTNVPCTANRLAVCVDGAGMAFVNGQFAAESMAEVYREMNPQSTIAIVPIKEYAKR